MHTGKMILSHVIACLFQMKADLSTMMSKLAVLLMVIDVTLSAPLRTGEISQLVNIQSISQEVL